MILTASSNFFNFLKESDGFVKVCLLLEDDDSDIASLIGEGVEIVSTTGGSLRRGIVSVVGAPLQQMCWVDIQLDKEKNEARQEKEQREDDAAEQETGTFILRKTNREYQWHQEPLSKSIHSTPLLAVPDPGGGTSRKLTMHLGFWALEIFYSQYGRYPLSTVVRFHPPTS